VKNNCPSSLVNVKAVFDKSGCDTALRFEWRVTWPPVIQPGSQGGTVPQAELMLECMQPFNVNPTLKFSFSVNGSNYAYAIPLPVVMTRFIAANDEMDKSQFDVRWDSMVEPLLQRQEVFNVPMPIDTPQMPRKLAAMTKMAVVGDIQMNPAVLHAVGTLKTGSPAQTGQPGAKISVGCMLRLEINAPKQAYRLTLRTTIPTVTNHLFDSIKKILSEA